MSTTTWQRIEPCPPADADAALRRALEARVHDPLFFLCRQWQMGEFEGEDAASPAAVRVLGDVASLSRYRPANGAATAYDPAQSPLQAVVARGAPSSDAPPSARLRAVAGLRLLRALRPVAPAVCEAYCVAPFALQALDPADPTADARSRDFIDALAGRVPDGAVIHARLAAGPEKLPGWKSAAARTAIQSWGRWYESEIATPAADAAPAWDAARFEYDFDVSAAFAAGDEVVLHAGECVENTDWLDFDVGSGSLDATVAASPVETPPVLPAPVTYPGMPAPRWWEIEGRRVDFGAANVEPEDLSHLLLLEFAVSYGNDWFLLPLDLDVGTLCRLRELQVRDAFGETISVAAPFAAGAGDWSLFSLTGDASRRLLLLPPTLAGAPHALEIERVELARDEAANVAWAVESVLEGQDGRPFDAAGRAPGSSGGAAGGAAAGGATAGGAALQYRLATGAPVGWLPLLPVRQGDGSVRLRLGRLFNAPAAAAPRARLLRGVGAVYEEEVPRGGAAVCREWRYARWSDGSAHVWIGRRKKVGRGEASSGLRFDVLMPASPESGG